MPSLHERVQAALGDRYRSERELGRGGMATVFLAEDLKHERPVALKVLHPDIAANLGAERFRQEVDFAAHLNHPHILPLIDSGETAGLFWYVMPFVEGESLRQRLDRQGRLSLAEAADIAQQAATAIDYAHQHGVIHRDIKPENLLLAHDHVWVADFGIARALRRSETVGGTGVFAVGTPPYMSPEQARGEEVDGRSDLYSLATVVYEGLAGAAPYPGQTPGEIAARRELGPPPPLRTIRPDLPGAATAAVHRALSADPAGRQTTAGAFARELAGTVSSPEVVRAARKASRRSVGATLATLAILGLAGYLILRPPPYDDRRVVILPPLLGETIPDHFGDDLSNSLWTHLSTTGALLPQVASARVLDRQAPDLRRLRRTYRNRYTIDSRVSQDDSLRVTVTVTDAGALASSPRIIFASLPASTSPWEASIQLVRRILPTLLPTGGELDPDLVGSRNIEALGNFLLGERAYRQARFAAADSFFDQAVAADSSFVWAALRGAQAASWRSEHGKALALIVRAEPYLTALGPRMVAFARGLRAYQEGRADQAIASLSEALASDPQWAEAWMAKGEVYHHLLPGTGRPMELASAAFDSARKYDPGFAPPLFHQIQHAVWARRTAGLDSLIALLDSTWSTSEFEGRTMVARAWLMREACVASQRGARGMTWEPFAGRYVESHPDDRDLEQSSRVWQLMTAVDLAGGGLQQAACAEDGLRHILMADTTRGGRLYATAALAYVEAARGLYDSAAALLRHEDLGNYRAPLTVMFALSGVPLTELADSMAQGLESQPWQGQERATYRSVRELWALGTWRLQQGRLGDARAIESRLRQIATGAHSSDPEAMRLARLLSRSLQARQVLATGDTTRALVLLDSLTPTVSQTTVTISLRWQPWEALAHEAMLRARLLEQAGRLREAYDAASRIDSPASYGLLLYLPQSLELRIELAKRLGLIAHQADLERRLADLRPSG